MSTGQTVGTGSGATESSKLADLIKGDVYPVKEYLRWMAELTDNKMFGLKAMLSDYNFDDVPEDYKPDGTYLHVDGDNGGLFYVPGKMDLLLRGKLKATKLC